MRSAHPLLPDLPSPSSLACTALAPSPILGMVVTPSGDTGYDRVFRPNRLGRDTWNSDSQFEGQVNSENTEYHPQGENRETEVHRRKRCTNGHKAMAGPGLEPESSDLYAIGLIVVPYQALTAYQATCWGLIIHGNI